MIWFLNKVIETIRKAHQKTGEAKIQLIDDFSEDINVLADKVDKEHKKESFRRIYSHILGNQFNLANHGNKLMKVKAFQNPNI